MSQIKKLQNGQFAVPSKLEHIYGRCPLIDQIYVDVNSKFNFMVAIVSLNEQKLEQFSEVNGLNEKNQKLLVNTDQV